MMRMLGLAIVVLLGLELSAQDLRMGCDCDSTMTTEAHLAEASVVFLGECIRINTNPIKGGRNITFAVDSSWIRQIEEVATVHTNADNQCGFPFKKGERYLVVAKKRHQTIETSICEPNVEEGPRSILLMDRIGTGFGPGRPELVSRMNLIILGLGIAGILFMAVIVLRKKIFPPKNAS